MPSFLHPSIDLYRHMERPRINPHNPGEKHAPILGNERTANPYLREAGAVMFKVKEDKSQREIGKYSSIFLAGFADELQKIAGASHDEKAQVLRSLLFAALGKSENSGLSIDRWANERTIYGDPETRNQMNYNQRVQMMASQHAMNDTNLARTREWTTPRPPA